MLLLANQAHLIMTENAVRLLSSWLGSRQPRPVHFEVDDDDIPLPPPPPPVSRKKKVLISYHLAHPWLHRLRPCALYRPCLTTKAPRKGVSLAVERVTGALHVRHQSTAL